MTTFVKGVIGGVTLVATLFTAAIFYSVKTVPPMMRGTKVTLDQFFTASQRHDHEAARTTFSSDLRADLSATRLQEVWRDFEKQNGPIKSWRPADASVPGGGRVCLWPRYVDYMYWVQGTKPRSSRVFYARIVPEGDQWRIDQLRAMKQNTLGQYTQK